MRKLLLFVICVSVSCFITFLLYNINFNLRIERYVSSLVLFFILSISIFHFSTFSNKITLLILISTPLLIDSSVLLTAPNLALLRFPFATSFTISGIILGYFIHLNKKRWLFIFGTIVVLYIILSYLFIIPNIIYFIENKKIQSLQIDRKFFDNSFITQNGDTIRLNDIMNKVNSIDLYFVGCSPCIDKENAYEIIKNRINSNKYSSIFICDGTLTNYDLFINSNKKKNLIYLFDYNKNINKFIKRSPGFPFEFILNKYKEPVITSTGYNEDLQSLFINNRLTLLNKLIYE